MWARHDRERKGIERKEGRKSRRKGEENKEDDS